KMVAEGIQALSKIDILVNNVAVRPHKPILEVTEEEWHDTLAINMHAAFYLCKAVLPGMMERKTGSIIALGGQSAITGRPGTSIVTTAKTGVLGLMRAVAAEMAPYNIRANMVNPGSTDTSRGNPEWYPEFQAGVERGSSEHLKEIPMGRQATVQDIANACLFFASDESGYITGDSVNVMGGRYIF
ncbi:MAG: SDR family oxidoreductase, partial [Chloroflexota bacterium]|nr:SDR family oxidoreductase [Chloroflexota bacterium]